ncbi:hypothetical protein C8R46DRAFT_1189279 [Mycena filopes]|nr:hypothetical protein C8R46DRAFT_1189279 [Mycena filopes]
MLSQMPTSALSFLSSSSKGLDGFFGLISVGIQMALTVVLAEFNTEFTTAVRATATVKLVLQPTKCVISNGTGFHPYVATMGSATIILLVVSYMLLRPKRRDTGNGEPAAPPSADKNPDPDNGGQPPSPPEDPDTESSAKKPRKDWSWLLYFFIWLFLCSIAPIYFTAYLHWRRLHVLHPIAHAIDRCFAFIRRVTASIIRRHRRAVWLALGSHIMCLALKLVFRRAWRCLRLRPTHKILTPIYAAILITLAFPQLHGTYWMVLYLMNPPGAYTVYSYLPPLLTSGLDFLAPFDPGDILMVGGPLALHAATTCIYFVLACIQRIHWACWRIHHHYSESIRAFVFTVNACISGLMAVLATIILILLSCLVFILAEISQGPGLWYQYVHWKAYQIHVYSILLSELSRLSMLAVWWCWGVWCTLSSAQKLLIVAPVAIFYAPDILATMYD